MSTIEQIETAILTLPPDEFQRLRQWFSDVDYQRWDRQLEQDVADGKLDTLAEEAISQFKRDIDISTSMTLHEPKQLDKLGQFLIENIRDANLDGFDGLISYPPAPFASHKLRCKINDNFTSEQLSIMREVITYCIDNTIGELLYNLDKSNYQSDVSICIDDRTVSEDGNCLRMELHSDEGWIARFSKHYKEDEELL